MDCSTFQTATRRSTRVRVRIPLLITGLDPTRPLRISCETLIVNAHGCVARLPQALELGVPVRIQVRETEATARVAACQPLEPSAWTVGFELQTPGNVWGLHPCPGDWERFGTDAVPAEGRAVQTTMVPPTQLKMPVWPLASPPVKTALSDRAGDKQLQKQLAAQQEAIAGLQDRVTNSLASVPELVRMQISDAQEQMLVPVRQELSAAVAEQFERLPGHIEQRAQAAFQALQERARAELERIIVQARSQEEPETEREALEASTRAVQKELEQARTLLESSMRSLPERIHQPIAAAVEDVLAQAREQISRQLTRELDSLRSEREANRAQLGEIGAKREELQLWLAEQQAQWVQNAGQRLEQLTQELAARTAGALDEKLKADVARELDSLRNEREANRAQLGEIGAKREELQLWLAEQQAQWVQNASQRLEQLTQELATRTAGALDEKLKADVERQAKHVESNLNQRLEPMLNQAIDLRQELLSLVGALQKESERGEARIGMLRKEKDGVEAWMAERVAHFHKMFQDALVETTGQIKGRLHMAVEMFEQPLAKLRDESLQQLQEQAGGQARLLREQVDEACDRLGRLQRQVESAVRESLRTQAAETSANFGREIAAVAQRSVEEWRSVLAENLESVANLLGQKFPGGEK